MAMNAHQCMTMHYYRIYVKLKKGGQATGRALHNGRPPPFGTQVDVPLMTGRTVKARIGSASTKRIQAARAHLTVYADEI